MTTRTAVSALALAALLVGAGCAAPVADETPAPRVEYEGGSLPFAAGPVFAQIETTLGVDVPAPDRVHVVSSPRNLSGSVAGASIPRFWSVAGVHTDSGLSQADVDRLENGVTSSIGTIAVYPGEDADAGDRWVLAHEFVHYVQFQRNAGERVGAAVPATTDGRYVQRSVLEGAAVFTTDAYIAAHAPDQPPNAALYRDLNETLVPGSLAWHYNLAYVEGREYVASRVAGPTALGAVYDRPPTTSEQVIHGLPPGAEPAPPLNLTADGGDWRVAATDRLGEAFVRTALAGTLDVGRASRAAAGWGNDTLLTFRRAGVANGSYAWVLRWDAPSEADEFASAMRDALAARGDAAGDGWRVAGVRAELRRADAQTTVLVAGNASFVNGTAVATDGGVTVTAP
ncbi:MAG: hypothetical protein ABEJ68_09305 [Halobacteriaceae archaeon]